MKSAKTKEKENRSFTGDPGVSKNHATAHKHYSYESWLRIWNPELFYILTRGPFSSSLRTEKPAAGRTFELEAHGRMVTSYGRGRPARSLPRPTIATPISWPAEAAAAHQRSSTGDGDRWERAGQRRRRVEDGRAVQSVLVCVRSVWLGLLSTLDEQERVSAMVGVLSRMDAA
jgi:hypothetical protein